MPKKKSKPFRAWISVSDAGASWTIEASGAAEALTSTRHYAISDSALTHLKRWLKKTGIEELTEILE